MLSSYRQTLEQLHTQHRVLERINSQIATLSEKQTPQNGKQLHALQAKAEQLRTKIAAYEAALQQTESSDVVQGVLQRMQGVASLQTLDQPQSPDYNIDIDADADTELFWKYRDVLGENAPASVEELRTIRENHPEQWRDLENRYFVLNQYEVLGTASQELILQLDSAAWDTKQHGFTAEGGNSNVRKTVKRIIDFGNAAAMEFEGTIYFAHSQINREENVGYKAYVGEYQVVMLQTKDNRKFEVKSLQPNDCRECDTEAKFMEFVASQKDPSDTFTITILSEKHICDSCLYVREQFLEMFPNATVNIISGKKGYNGSLDGLKTWKGRK